MNTSLKRAPIRKVFWFYGNRTSTNRLVDSLVLSKMPDNVLLRDYSGRYVDIVNILHVLGNRNKVYVTSTFHPTELCDNDVESLDLLRRIAEIRRCDNTVD